MQTYSHAQARVHTVGLHTCSTQLGMRSCRMGGSGILQLAFLSRERATVLHSYIAPAVPPASCLCSLINLHVSGQDPPRAMQ